MEYENETCEGCTLFRGNGRSCTGSPTVPAGDDRVFRNGAICDDFAPSLDCRDVRASERTAGALVRLADRFTPVVTPSMAETAVHAVEAWLDYNTGRADSNGFHHALAEYGRAKDAAGK